MNPDFRAAAADKVKTEAAGKAGFDFFSSGALTPSDFEVVYAIIASWDGRTPAQALPFFSKINLRQFTTTLRSRGFRVGFNRIHAT
jgi:uncharacterized protein (TIGR04141 family)